MIPDAPPPAIHREEKSGTRIHFLRLILFFLSKIMFPFFLQANTIVVCTICMTGEGAGGGRGEGYSKGDHIVHLRKAMEKERIYIIYMYMYTTNGQRAKSTVGAAKWTVGGGKWTVEGAK